jgi:hypothetical protein
MAGPRRRPRGAGPAPRKVVVRFTEDEHEVIRRAAAAPGQGVSLARFVADAALTAAGLKQPVPSLRSAPTRLVLAEVMTAVAAVNRIGNNLNQLAREKNVTGLRPVGSLEAEQRAVAALLRLADTVERADGSVA